MVTFLSFTILFYQSLSQELDHLAEIQPMIEVDAESEAKQFSKDWEELQGFAPEQMLTFDLPAGAEFEFFEKFESVPGKLQGAWFLASKNVENIDFLIKDPNGRVIYKKMNVKEVVFNLDTKTLGTYSLQFINKKIVGSQPITFACSTGDKDGLLKGEHLNPVEQNILKIDKAIKDFQVDNQFAQLRQETHFQTVASANNNVFWFALVESLGVLAVTAWQIYYIKKLLDNRKVM